MKYKKRNNKNDNPPLATGIAPTLIASAWAPGYAKWLQMYHYWLPDSDTNFPNTLTEIDTGECGANDNSLF